MLNNRVHTWTDIQILLRYQDHFPIGFYTPRSFWTCRSSCHMSRRQKSQRSAGGERDGGRETKYKNIEQESYLATFWTSDRNSQSHKCISDSCLMSWYKYNAGPVMAAWSARNITIMTVFVTGISCGFSVRIFMAFITLHALCDMQLFLSVLFCRHAWG